MTLGTMIEINHSQSDLQARRGDYRHTHALIVDKKLLTTSNNMEILEIVRVRVKNAKIVELKELRGTMR